MKKFFEKFKEIEAKKTILIVDDLEEMVKRYQSAAQGFDLNIQVAHSVEEAIEKAKQLKPDYALLDKDMPDGSGNQVAEVIKKLNPEARIAGFTGGDPQEFKPEYFDIRESKVSEAKAKEIIKILIESEDPRKSYHSQADIKAQMAEVGEFLVSMDILIQGYDMAKKLQALEQGVPYEGLESPTLAEVKELKEKAGLKVPAAPEVIFEGLEEIFQDRTLKTLKEGLEKIPAFRDSQEIKEFIHDLEKKDFQAIAEKKQYIIFHEKYLETAEALK